MNNFKTTPSLPGIRAATLEDIPGIARIHKSQFAGYFLACYSLPAIEQFYVPFLDDALFLTHEGESGVDGFVVGAERHVCAACKRRFIRGSALRLGWETMKHPRLWLDALRQARRQLRVHRLPAQPSPEFRLLCIAVDPHVVGSGVAVGLVRAFEISIPKKFAAYGLSVRRNNDRAIRFYEKLDFHREVDELSSGGYSYTKCIPGRPEPACSSGQRATVADGSNRLCA